MIFLSSISTDTFNGLSALRLFKLRNERRVTSPGSKSGGRIRKGKEIKQKWRFDSRHATIRYTARKYQVIPCWNNSLEQCQCLKRSISNMAAKFPRNSTKQNKTLRYDITLRTIDDGQHELRYTLRRQKFDSDSKNNTVTRYHPRPTKNKALI